MLSALFRPHNPPRAPRRVCSVLASGPAGVLRLVSRPGSCSAEFRGLSCYLWQLSIRDVISVDTWLTQAMTPVLGSRESVPALALPHLSGRCQALVQGTCRLHPLRTRLPAAVMYTCPRDTGYGKQFQGPQQQQQEEGNQTCQSIRTFWRHARFRRMRNHRAS